MKILGVDPGLRTSGYAPAAGIPLVCLYEDDTLVVFARDSTLDDLTFIPAEVQEDLESVALTMTENRFRHLPILEGDKLVGIVSIGDVVKAQRDEFRGLVDTLQTLIDRDDA